MSYFFITAVITKAFIPTARLALLVEIPIKEAKGEIEMEPVTIETKKKSVQYNLKSYKPSWASYLLIDFALFFW